MATTDDAERGAASKCPGADGRESSACAGATPHAHAHDQAHAHAHDHAHEHAGHGAAAKGESADGCGSGCCAADIAPPPPPTDTRGRVFEVAGLDCAEEVAILERAVGPKVGGRENLAFDVLNGRMIVREAADEVPDEEILAAVAATGMTARRWQGDDAGARQEAHLRRQQRFTALSGAFWFAGILYHLSAGGGGLLRLFAGHEAEAIPWPERLLYLAAIVFGVRLVAPKAWSAARRLAPDMNLLMVVAVTGAIVIDQLFEAATVAFLFALSLTLESWSVGRARRAVAALLDLAPPTARVRRPDGSEAEVPAAQVQVGELFVVRGGDRIPLDGIVVEGRGAVNQAPITGESAPVPKEPGDEVFAGTINGEGTLVVRATHRASDTVLARIIRMVSEAHARRAPVEQWVMRFARVYTPAVMALAVAIFLVPPLAFGGAWDYWLYNALVLLVIACPCALVISTPVSIVAALASAARNGVLIKGGAYIEAPARLAALAMDKTGTITRGEPEVAGLHPLGETDEERLLAVAAALEARSSHPLARAILEAAEAAGLEVRPAEGVEIVPGRGVTGRLHGREVWLGSPRFAAERGLGEALPEALLASIEARGRTAVVVGEDGRLLGIIAVADAIRPEAHGIVAELHRLGVRRIVMLTGDNPRAARAVAEAVGIDEVRAELLPEDKVKAVEELARSFPVVAMVGDGVNDAPAMARAHLGIAMGAAGSDAAIETADIALMTDDIAKLPWLVRHARRTLRVIRENITLSLAVKAAFVVLTAFGMATMWGAILADVGVSLVVVANALRLLRSPGAAVTEAAATGAAAPGGAAPGPRAAAPSEEHPAGV